MCRFPVPEMPRTSAVKPGRHERGHRDDREQDDPDGGVEERERPAAGVVVHLTANDRVPGHVGHPGARAEQHDQDHDHDQVRDQRDQRERDGRGGDAQAEQAPSAEAAQDAHAEEHAAGQPDEDRGEHDAPPRIAAVQRVLDVRLAQPDHHAAGRERADHADDQPADHLGAADELPAFPDRLGHRRRRDVRAELPFRDLPECVDGHRGHHERDRVEVQRQVHRVGGEVVRDVAQRPADQRQQAEDRARRWVRCRTW